jgi:hypothetical protein
MKIAIAESYIAYMFYIVKIYICVKKIFYMMGNKKVAQGMQPTESGSFLAGQQPTAEVGEVSGIQKEQKTEQIETKFSKKIKEA